MSPSVSPMVSTRFAETCVHSRELRKREEHGSKFEADINGPLHRLAVLGEMAQRRQRLLEVCERLPVGPSRGRLGPGLPEVGHSLPPCLGPERMVSEPLDVLGQASGI